MERVDTEGVSGTMPERILREQVKLAFGQQPMALSISSVLALVLIFVFNGNILPSRIYIWLFFLLSISMIRAWKTYRFRAIRESDFPPRRWRNVFVAGVGVSAFIWGTSVFVFLPVGQPVEMEILIVLTLAGMTSAAIVSQSAILRAALLWVSITMAPAIAYFFMASSPYAVTLGLFILVYSLAMAVYARHLHRTITESIILRFDNLELLRETRETAASFRKVLDFAPSAIAVSYNDIILYANRRTAEMVGAASAEDLTGVFFPPPSDLSEQIYARLARVDKGEVVEPALYKLPRLDGGTPTIIEVATTRIMFMGKPAFITIGRDVAKQMKEEEELRNAKETAEAATKLKDEFVLLVSHDLKSPLSAIKRMLEMIENNTVPVEEVREKRMFRHMADTAAALLNYIDMLLQRNRLKSGKMILEKRFVHAREVADKYLQAGFLAATHKGIALANELPPDIRVFADPDLFGQVVHNLLTNAVKFTPEGGHITVFCPSPGKPVIAVRDNGVGVEEHIRRGIFRGDTGISAPGTAGERGTGLGLPFAYEIMRAHGGTLEFADAPGGGCIFIATFQEHRAVILLVDDDHARRTGLKLAIAAIDGMDVVEAESGAAALEFCRQSTPDLVVIGLPLPEMDGLDLIRRIREDGLIGRLPIIVLSDKGQSAEDDEMRRNVMLTGADELLAGVAEPNLIVNILRRHLN